MHLLITRPETEAATFRARLEALGHTVSVDPLLTIEHLPVAADALRGTTGLIVTSRNGLRALAAPPAIDDARKLPLIAVGTGTEQLARDLGFESITVGPGTGADLVPIIVQMAGASPGPFTHVRGEDVAFDLKTALASHGIDLRELVTYRARAAERLHPDTENLLAEGKLDAIILMSPRTARIFTQLVQAAALEKAVKALRLLCLSPAVAAAIEPIGATRVEVAERPNLEGMLATVT